MTLRQKTGSYYWTLPQRRWKATQQVMRTKDTRSLLRCHGAVGRAQSESEAKPTPTANASGVPFGSFP